jgi:hypothetical protein
MVLRIPKYKENRIFRVYLVAMFLLMVARYLLKIDVPAIAFLALTLLPAWFGTKSEQLAMVASCIPLSVAFQYKYALLILSAAILIRNRWKLNRSGAFMIILAMAIWEWWHAFYGRFSYVEYLRDFAELILLGLLISIDLDQVNYKLIIRSLAISVVGVCAIMLVMQLEQFDYNILAVFGRSAHSFRFGQSNMESGVYALNFNANNLGFICNLATCGVLLLVARREGSRFDIIMAVSASIFALMTLSRAAIVCLILIFFAFMFLGEGKILQKVFSSVVGIVVAVIAMMLLWIYIPSVFENIQERFERADVSGGRTSLFLHYGQFLLSSPAYFLGGIGMQHIFEKVSPYFAVHDVPHMGLQEVWVAWGIVGVFMIILLFWKIVSTSLWYSQGKRRAYQFMPLCLTLVFTMSGQLLTSSRTLMALIFAYVCLCISNDSPKENAEDLLEAV